jgi:hypothetical protein
MLERSSAIAELLAPDFCQVKVVWLDAATPTSAAGYKIRHRFIDMETPIVG